MNRTIIPINSVSKNNSSSFDDLISVRLPGSKYIANRLLPLCALASTPSHLSNVVDNDDINAATKGLKALGYQLEFGNSEMKISPRQNNGDSDDHTFTKNISFNTHHSGTFSRFVTVIAALEKVPVEINCSEKMATRPMKELFDSLRELGVKIDSQNERLPAIVNGPFKANQCKLDASRSSQYLSALLIVAPLLDNGLTIDLVGKQVSNAYVDMTINLMNKMGVKVVRDGNQLTVSSGQEYKGIEYTVPCDPVSSSYFMGFAAISGQKIKIEAFDHKSLQGEAQFYKVLEKMGVRFEKDDSSLTIISDGELKGIEIDMGEMPDVVQTLAVVASHAKGKTLIKNIAHLAFKESDRIKDTATELQKAGIKVEAGDDYLLIEGGKPIATEIETYDDHRMAMSMALLGTKTDGIVIKDANVVNKSFPSYWDLLAQVGLQSKAEGDTSDD
ncbi:MAG: 3-phosphoshikimate 1-carboxyvinyltransferase [Gammaproteobacteria bacterium]|nr:MAG: 3-phosphoshikimate 1-carboxyvinyltransferase [Gammaproteobacteria bacterium]